CLDACASRPYARSCAGYGKQDGADGKRLTAEHGGRQQPAVHATATTPSTDVRTAHRPATSASAPSSADALLSVTLPTIAAPKGGCAIRGIGETFRANPVTGTGSLAVPLPGRGVWRCSGFEGLVGNFSSPQRVEPAAQHLRYGPPRARTGVEERSQRCL